MERQLRVLFFCNLCMMAVGNGVLPLAPVYLLGLGASQSEVGIAIAGVFAALAIGNALSGAIADLIGSRKRTFVAAGLVSVPLLVGISAASAPWHVAALMIGAWFCGGVCVGLVNVLTGAYADPARRGRTFGLMYLAAPLGTFLGPLLCGALVEALDYRWMFVLVGSGAVVWPLAGALGLREGVGAHIHPSPWSAGEKSALGIALATIFAAAVVTSVATSIGRLGTSLTMEVLRFSPSAIGGAAAIGGLATIPVLPLTGWLSDRLGRRWGVIAAYLLGAAGISVLAGADLLWQFWLAAALLSVASSVGAAGSAALATDILRPNQLARGLALMSAAPSVGSVIGFVATGYILVHGGATVLYIVGVLPVLAALLLASTRQAQHSLASETGATPRDTFEAEL